MSYIQTCSQCNSEEVARCKWVNVNTDHVYNADSGTTLEWCFSCNEQTSIVEKLCVEEDKLQLIGNS